MWVSIGFAIGFAIGWISMLVISIEWPAVFAIMENKVREWLGS